MLFLLLRTFDLIADHLPLIQLPCINLWPRWIFETPALDQGQPPQPGGGSSESHCVQLQLARWPLSNGIPCLGGGAGRPASCRFQFRLPGCRIDLLEEFEHFQLQNPFISDVLNITIGLLKEEILEGCAYRSRAFFWTLFWQINSTKVGSFWVFLRFCLSFFKI